MRSGSLSLTSSTEDEVYSTQWPVTTNLDAALRYLRHGSEVRIIWVDAICIDQSNIEERNHQVPLMKAIYSNAVAVQVWLGSPSKGSDGAMEILKQNFQGIPLPEAKVGDSLLQDDDLWSVIELMRRPWWTRTWVRQELILSKRVFIHCGFNSISWNEMKVDHLLKGRAQLLKEVHGRFNSKTVNQFNDCLDFFVQIDDMARFSERSSDPTVYDPAMLLALGRQCNNSDDRDSIYGFLGLMGQNFQRKIKPDYKLSTPEVYLDAAIQLALCSNSLICLSLTKYSAKNVRWLPTWVPSWQPLGTLEAQVWDRRVRNLIGHEIFSACGENTLEFQVVDGRILKVSGVKLDHVLSDGIAGCSEALFGTEQISAMQQEWRYLCGINMHNRSNYVAGGKATNAFWRTLVNDKHVKEDFITRRRCQKEDCKNYRTWVDELGDSDTPYWKSVHAQNYHSNFTEACLGRRFFVTKKGYFGIGPAELEEGDEIYILAGGKFPLVLRPSPESQPNTFELVGDCYVHGVMDGEAVTERTQRSGQSPWKKAVATSKGFIRSSNKSLDPDLPLRDFHDVFIV
ncbi:heterokaryon incompatibility protein-domain-containing protein [Hyaloscypha finlandica]|nr:heterokaryon incompatibility protein-domain-containing protein [Hyaloscypha finlandica]